MEPVIEEGKAKAPMVVGGLKIYMIKITYIKILNKFITKNNK